jgi:hypothetical protein
MILYRDYVFETDLRAREKNEFGLGTYGGNSFSIPLEAGIDFRISDRVSCRLGTSIHYSFTDYIDNVSSEGTSVKGKKGNDIFSFNYFSIRLDLFSEPKTKVIEKMFAEMETDSIMIDDEDGDFILDPSDLCPGTPLGVVVDTSGCPLDLDGDGIPDHLDEEQNTLQGVWVDDKGRTVSEEDFLSRLNKREKAMNRQDVKAYLETLGSVYVTPTVTEIPEKFKYSDTNNDGYISFEELLDVIDDFFDFKLNFTVEDIYQLNNYFFTQ